MTRRRFLASLLALCVAFLPLTASSAPLFSGKQMVASGTVTDANMTITLTAGSADIDFSSATVPRNYQGYELHIQDSTGREVIGFVYTNGAGTVQNIVSAKGGSTRNWTYQHASFDTTDDYKYQLFKIWPAPIVASGPVTAANSHLDTTAANAFAWLNGVDLSAYQDDRHMLWVYDSSGRGRGGFISSSAPAGETLGVALITGDNSTFASDTGWWSVGSGIAIGGGVCSHTVGAYLSKSNLTVSGGLYTYTFTVLNYSLPNIAVWLGSGSTHGTARTANGTYTEYRTSDGGVGFYIGNGGFPPTLQIDDLTMNRVTDPPSTAVKILSAKAGARGWLYADAAFDPNTAATYAVLFVGD